MEAVAMKTHYGNQTSITPHSAENYVINFFNIWRCHFALLGALG